MHEGLQKEIAIYEKRRPKSAQAPARALKRIPLGVASNSRAYDPYPIFVKAGKGSKIRDIDGNEYLDHNLCFGALMVGHCHPAIVKAIEKALHVGTTFGMPHDMEWELAGEICARYPVEMVRFGSSGTEVTMHACRMARAATKRDKILTFEGAYHGLHDTALVSVKPILMNVGLCMPQPGFLQGLRDIATTNGALLIFDEVKTGAKLAWGGASDFFGVKPDIICLAKSIGGGAPLGAFGASRAVMDLISQHKVFHGGTYNTNRISMAAGLATFCEGLPRETYVHLAKLTQKPTERNPTTLSN